MTFELSRPADISIEAFETAVLDAARAILSSRLRVVGDAFTSPTTVREFLVIEFSELEHEVFGVMFLNNRHQLISFDVMFRGTIDAAAVYPREVVKAALQHNAAAVIVAHNHPSGNPDPSQADRALTKRLGAALALLDIRLLDHIIIGGADAVSFASEGLL